MYNNKNSSNNTPGKDPWTLEWFLEDQLDIERKVARNLIRLFHEEATIPFITRYRADQTNGMNADQVRKAQAVFNESKNVKAKMETVAKNIEKQGKMTPKLSAVIHEATSIQELEEINAPFKAASKGSLVERAKALGLEETALSIVLNGAAPNFNSFIKSGTKGLDSLKAVNDGVKTILSDHFVKSTETQIKIRHLMEDRGYELECTLAKKQDDITDEQRAKFTLYSNFKNRVGYIKPHQILAINRGEKMKILKTKINCPEWIGQKYAGFVRSEFGRRLNPQMSELFESAVQDSYNRLVQPRITRSLRAKLNEKGELASLEVFSSNLRQVLLSPPLRSRTPLLGIDPGFSHGCKMAVISPNNDVISTSVFHLPKNHGGSHLHTGNKGMDMTPAGKAVRDVILKHGCEHVGIGNGKGCRETEQLLSQLIKTGSLKPLNVQFVIVSEAGASCYSVTKLAEEELPGMAVNLRSAVSIARRLQDPLAELVKIEPEHIGVGMYQHDAGNKSLGGCLNSVVEECVSFVGVDLNTCSLQLLKLVFSASMGRVAGLNQTKAQNILSERTAKGAFSARNQLLKVKGVGAKSFEQAAGFLRIYCSTSSGSEGKDVDNPMKTSDDPSIPSKGKKRKIDSSKSTATVGAKKRKTDTTSSWTPLEATSVHPESYDDALAVLNEVGLSTDDIGSPKAGSISDDVWMKAAHKLLTTSALSSSSATDKGELTWKSIIQALKQPKHYDMRQEQDKPVFRSGVQSAADLKVGTEVSGVVTNCTHFGAFVDIGVGKDALVHVSKMGGRTLQVGNRIECKVLTVDTQRDRIGLGLVM